LLRRFQLPREAVADHDPHGLVDFSNPAVSAHATMGVLVVRLRFVTDGRLVAVRSPFGRALGLLVRCSFLTVGALLARLFRSSRSDSFFRFAMVGRMLVASKPCSTEVLGVGFFDLFAIFPPYADDVDEIGIVGEKPRKLRHIMAIPAIGETCREPFNLAAVGR
jgi:hypothetical protein